MFSIKMNEYGRLFNGCAMKSFLRSGNLKQASFSHVSVIIMTDREVNLPGYVFTMKKKSQTKAKLKFARYTKC